MDSKTTTLVAILIIGIIIFLLLRGILNRSNSDGDGYFPCEDDADCPAGYCYSGKCRDCTLDSDCPNKGDYCYAGLCEPSTTGRHPCLERETTGDIEVTKYPTDFGSNPSGGQTCFFFLGDMSNAMVSQRFSATWLPTRITRAGGFILTWGGPTGVRNDQDRIAIFDTNVATVTKFEYEHEGGFALSRQASLPCHQQGHAVNLTFTVQPVNVWEQAPNITWSKTGNMVSASWDAVPGVDKYIVSAKVERLQVVDPLGAAEMFPVTYAYHGGVTDHTSMSISLPAYYFDSAELISEYGLVKEVRVFGFKSCNLNSKTVGAVETTVETGA